MPQPIPDLSRDQQCFHYQAPTGERCGSPALKGQYYCYHHIVKNAARSNRTFLIDPEITCMEIPPIEDRASIFIALAAVVHRLAENTIDTRRAGQMIYGLQVAMRALEPPPSQRCRTSPETKSASQPATAHPTKSCHSERAQRAEEPREPTPTRAANTTPPPDPPAPTTISISKQSLLYFLRSRHCASCNAELFPANQLTERPNPGAPPEIIEEARRALPAPEPRPAILPSLHAGCPVLTPLGRDAATPLRPQRRTNNGQRTTVSAAPFLTVSPSSMANRHRNRHSLPALLYTHLGARYPRDLRVQLGISLRHPVRPHRILTQKANRRTKWQQ